MSRDIKHGATDQSTTVRFLDSTDGTPETGVDHSTTGLALWYRREGGAKTTITPAALASLTATHADGGVEPISDGYVRIDMPDAACASGVDGVLIGGSATGMVVQGAYHALKGNTEKDVYDRVGVAGAGLTDLGGMSTGMKAEVNAEVVDVITIDTIAALTKSAPPMPATIAEMNAWLYTVLVRNRVTLNKTDGRLVVFQDDGTTELARQPVTDDGTTFDKSEMVTGV